MDNRLTFKIWWTSRQVTYLPDPDACVSHPVDEGSTAPGHVAPPHTVMVLFCLQPLSLPRAELMATWPVENYQLTNV